MARLAVTISGSRTRQLDVSSGAGDRSPICRQTVKVESADLRAFVGGSRLPNGIDSAKPDL
jgi:hypothetical protein